MPIGTLTFRGRVVVPKPYIKLVCCGLFFEQVWRSAIQSVLVCFENFPVRAPEHQISRIEDVVSQRCLKVCICRHVYSCGILYLYNEAGLYERATSNHDSKRRVNSRCVDIYVTKARQILLQCS